MSKPRLYAHIPPLTRALEFAHARIKQIDDDMQQLKMERMVMQELIDRCLPDLCARCHGHREVAYQNEDGEMKYQPCPSCAKP